MDATEQEGEEQLEQKFVDAVVKGEVDDWSPQKLRWMFLADLTVQLTRILDPTVECVASSLWHGDPNTDSGPLAPLQTPLANWWLTVPTPISVDGENGGRKKSDDASARSCITSTAKALLGNHKIAESTLEKIGQSVLESQKEKVVATISDILTHIPEPKGTFIQVVNNPLNEGFRFDKPLWTIDFEMDKVIISECPTELNPEISMATSCFRLCFHKRFPPNLRQAKEKEVRDLAEEGKFKEEFEVEFQRLCGFDRSHVLEVWWKGFQKIRSIKFQEIKVIRSWALNDFTRTLDNMANKDSDLKNWINNTTGRDSFHKFDEAARQALFEHLHGEGHSVDKWQALMAELSNRIGKKHFDKIHMRNTLNDDKWMMVNSPIQALKILYKFPFHEPEKVTSWSDLDITALHFFLCELKLIADENVVNAVKALADFRNGMFHKGMLQLDNDQFAARVGDIKALANQLQTSLCEHLKVKVGATEAEEAATKELAAKVVSHTCLPDGWEKAKSKWLEDFKKLENGQEVLRGLVAKLVDHSSQTGEALQECLKGLEEKVEQIKHTTEETLNVANETLQEVKAAHETTKNVEHNTQSIVETVNDFVNPAPAHDVGARVAAQSKYIDQLVETLPEGEKNPLADDIVDGQILWIKSPPWSLHNAFVAELVKLYKDKAKTAYHSFHCGARIVDPDRTREIALKHISAQIGLRPLGKYEENKDEYKAVKAMLESLSAYARGNHAQNFLLILAGIEWCTDTMFSTWTSVLRVLVVPGNMCILITSALAFPFSETCCASPVCHLSADVNPANEMLSESVETLFHEYFVDPHYQWERLKDCDKENKFLRNLLLFGTMITSKKVLKPDVLKYVVSELDKYPPDVTINDHRAVISRLMCLDSMTLQAPLRKVAEEERKLKEREEMWNNVNGFRGDWKKHVRKLGPDSGEWVDQGTQLLVGVIEMYGKWRDGSEQVEEPKEAGVAKKISDVESFFNSLLDNLLHLTKHESGRECFRQVFLALKQSLPAFAGVKDQVEKFSRGVPQGHDGGLVARYFQELSKEWSFRDRLLYTRETPPANRIVSFAKSCSGRSDVSKLHLGSLCVRIRVADDKGVASAVQWFSSTLGHTPAVLEVDEAPEGEYVTVQGEQQQNRPLFEYVARYLLRLGGCEDALSELRKIDIEASTVGAAELKPVHDRPHESGGGALSNDKEAVGENTSKPKHKAAADDSEGDRIHNAPSKDKGKRLSESGKQQAHDTSDPQGSGSTKPEIEGERSCSDVDHGLEIHRRFTAADIKLEYEAKTLARVVKGKKEPYVLFVLLAPSHSTAAMERRAPNDWNPFHTVDGRLVKSMEILQELWIRQEDNLEGDYCTGGGQTEFDFEDYSMAHMYPHKIMCQFSKLDDEVANRWLEGVVDILKPTIVCFCVGNRVRHLDMLKPLGFDGTFKGKQIDELWGEVKRKNGHQFIGISLPHPGSWVGRGIYSCKRLYAQVAQYLCRGEWSAILEVQGEDKEPVETVVDDSTVIRRRNRRSVYYC